MITTVEVRTIDAVKDLLFEQTHNPHTGRYRSSYFYRGLPDAEFSLLTSLQMNCVDQSADLEIPLLENFIKYASIDFPTISDSVWKAMIIGQHHGLPTRLMDWSHSTLSALHFATTEADLTELDKRDCAVWRVDAKELNKFLPDDYQAELERRKTFLFSVETLSSITNSIEEYDAAMDGKAFVTLEPPSIDQRIVNQYSFFTVMPKGLDNLEDFLNDNTENTVKYVIDKSLRWELRDILDQLNMNERMIYPGVDGIAKWLARRYYVKR